MRSTIEAEKCRLREEKIKISRQRAEEKRANNELPLKECEVRTTMLQAFLYKIK